MVKIDNNINQNQTNSQTNQTENCGFDTQTNQTNNQTQTKSENKSSLLTMIGQLLPLAPFAFEQFTGQKVPHMSGTMADIQTALLQIQANQQTLNQRLIALEQNANQHLTNLTNQFKSLRLTHTKEQKQIEYNNENQEY